MVADKAGEEQPEAAEEDSITSGFLGSVPWGDSKPFPGRGSAEAGNLEHEANEEGLEEEFSEDDEDGTLERELLLLNAGATNEAEEEAEAEDAWYADSNQGSLFLAALGSSGLSTGLGYKEAETAGGSPASGEDEGGLLPELPLRDAGDQGDSTTRLQRVAQLLEEAELREAAAGSSDEANANADGANADTDETNADAGEATEEDEEDDGDLEGTVPEEALQQRLGQQLGGWGEEDSGGAAEEEDLADPALAASLAAEVKVCVEGEEGVSDEEGNTLAAAAGQGNVGGVPEDGYEAVEPLVVQGNAADTSVADAAAESTEATGSSSTLRICTIPKAKSRPTPEGCEEVALQVEATFQEETQPHSNGIQVRSEVDAATAPQLSSLTSAPSAASISERASEHEVRRKYLALLELAAEQKKALNLTLFEITELEASLGLVDDAENVATNGFDCQGLSVAQQSPTRLRRGRPLACKAGAPVLPPSAKADAEQCAKRRRLIDPMDAVPAANEVAG